MLPARSSRSRKSHVMPSSSASGAAAASSGGSAATRDSRRRRFLSHVAVGLSGGSRKRPEGEDAASGSHLDA
uniref:Uncharacterized protein n=1 Tax=Arundo donax TaxID=35708 RepID=A0A0A9GIE4_ARUDO